MYAIHSAEVAVWICVEDPQVGFVPCTSKVNPEASVVSEGVSDPVSPEAILHDNDDVAAIVEIPHGDTSPFARPMADGFNDKRVSSCIWRPRDTSQQGEVCDLIRDTNDPFRKAHLIAPSSLTIVIIPICITHCVSIRLRAQYGLRMAQCSRAARLVGRLAVSYILIVKTEFIGKGTDSWLRNERGDPHAIRKCVRPFE